MQNTQNYLKMVLPAVKLSVAESQWMEEQPAHDNEQISSSEQPEQASLKATKILWSLAF